MSEKEKEEEEQVKETTTDIIKKLSNNDNKTFIIVKKKKHKKKHYPYIKEKSDNPIIEIFLYNLFLIGCICICIYMGYVIVQPPDVHLLIEDKNYNLIKKGSDTRSMIYINNGDSKSPSQYRTLLLQYYHKHPVVCHHHIDTERPKYRICIMERNYLLINPSISVSGDQKFIKDITENSISCKNETLKKRFQCVKMQWTDEYNHQLEGNICGETAIALQMMMDEFEGNKHC